MKNNAVAKPSVILAMAPEVVARFQKIAPISGISMPPTSRL